MEEWHVIASGEKLLPSSQNVAWAPMLNLTYDVKYFGCWIKILDFNDAGAFPLRNKQVALLGK